MLHITHTTGDTNVNMIPTNSMDRAIIMRHLLSNPSDPFTRTPLTPDMLVEGMLCN